MTGESLPTDKRVGDEHFCFFSSPTLFDKESKKQG